MWKGVVSHCGRGCCHLWKGLLSLMEGVIAPVWNGFAHCGRGCWPCGRGLLPLVEGVVAPRGRGLLPLVGRWDWCHSCDVLLVVAPLWEGAGVVGMVGGVRWDGGLHLFSLNLRLFTFAIYSTNPSTETQRKLCNAHHCSEFEKIMSFMKSKMDVYVELHKTQTSAWLTSRCAPCGCGCSTLCVGCCPFHGRGWLPLVEGVVAHRGRGCCPSWKGLMPLVEGVVAPLLKGVVAAWKGVAVPCGRGCCPLRKGVVAPCGRG